MSMFSAPMLPRLLARPVSSLTELRSVSVVMALVAVSAMS